MTLALLLTAATGAWAGVTPVSVAGNWLNPQWDATTNQMAYNDGVYSITFSNMPAGQNYEFKFALNNSWDVSYGYSSTTAVELNKTLEIATQSGVDTNIKFDLAEACDVTISFNLTEPRTFMISTSGLVIGEDDKAPIKVAYNTAKTEASFQMPQYDVTATYTIKRDISVDVTATMGDGTDGVRYRVKQEGGFWHPVDITSQAQLLALLNVTDQIENTNLVIGTDYEFRFYAVDDEGQPTGEGMNLGSFQFAPGRYAVRCFAKEGSNYVGEAALSNVFTLFQGYELEIPAGEYATYYMNEPLSVDESTPEGQLYTISSVNLENATATATELSVAEANTPLLVKNNADETKRILLVPSVETADEVTVAPEFKGTLVDKTFTDEDMHDADHYVCNGRAFVWVMDAGVIAPNRAWLEIEKEEVESARTLQIVFGDATGVNDVIGAEDGNDGWYDLNGRKLRKAPAQKGVFIQNGNKVLVK